MGWLSKAVGAVKDIGKSAGGIVSGFTDYLDASPSALGFIGGAASAGLDYLTSGDGRSGEYVGAEEAKAQNARHNAAIAKTADKSRIRRGVMQAPKIEEIKEI